MEALIGQKLPAYTCDEETVLVLQERVGEAQRMAAREMREESNKWVFGTIIDLSVRSTILEISSSRLSKHAAGFPRTKLELSLEFS